MPTKCHLSFINGDSEGDFILLQEVVNDTERDRKNYGESIVQVNVPDNLLEIVDFYDDVFTGSSFKHAGLGIADDIPYNEATKIAHDLLTSGKYDGFIVKPYERDSCGYANPSNLYVLLKDFKHLAL